MRRNPILYVILCHSNASYVYDLFRYMYNNEDIFLFHADSKSELKLIERIKTINSQYKNTYILQGLICSWGGYSLVETLFRAIDRSLIINPNWSHLVLLSEYHIPLYSSEEIFNRLQPGVSWIDASRVNEMFIDNQNEIRSRFSMCYRELPGVGPFASSPRMIHSDIWDKLYHGSQWVILARNACERINNERKDHTDLINILASSALPDETAIPTLLLGTVLGRDISIEPKNSTYLAWPHVGGLPDMTFTDININSAREQEFLFIRKRPVKLSANLIGELEKNTKISINYSDTSVQEYISKERNNILLRSMNIYDTINFNFQNLNCQNIASEGQGICPAFYIRLTQKYLSKNEFSINVISEDLINFKVLVMISKEKDRCFFERSDIIISMIRARIHGLAYNMEVFIPQIKSNGFIYCLDNNFDEIILATKECLEFIERNNI